MTVSEYNQCVELHADNLYRFVLKNIRDEEKAKDLVQDTFEKMWLKRRSINAEKAKSYMFTTGYRNLIDLVRREKKQGTFNDVNTEELWYTDEYTGVQELLHRAIEQLPLDQRSVVLLRDYEGYSYKEIEAITGLKEPQVKVYIYRARKFLKKRIGSLSIVI